MTEPGLLGLRVFIPALCASACVACGPAAAPTQRPAAPSADQPVIGEEDESRTPWEACYGSFSPAGDAKGDLARLVRDCGSTGGMQAVTDVHVGEQAAEDPVDRYTFGVAAGKCYRVYAAADASVKDLDLVLRGPSKSDVFADATHDSWPVLPPHEPACFDLPGPYVLEVSVYRGAGHYAVQVWGR